MYPPYDHYQTRAGSRQIPWRFWSRLARHEREAFGLGATEPISLFSRPYSNEVIGRHSMGGDEDLFAPAACLVKSRLNHFQLGS
jgi:hypothetical protein